MNLKKRSKYFVKTTIIFLGTVNDIPKIINDYDTLINPIFHENGGLTLNNCNQRLSRLV